MHGSIFRFALQLIEYYWNTFDMAVSQLLVKVIHIKINGIIMVFDRSCSTFSTRKMIDPLCSSQSMKNSPYTNFLVAIPRHTPRIFYMHIHVHCPPLGARG